MKKPRRLPVLREDIERIIDDAIIENGAAEVDDHMLFWGSAAEIREWAVADPRKDIPGPPLVFQSREFLAAAAAIRHSIIDRLSKAGYAIVIARKP